jgi:DNA-binding CsgD family transcriptional regulator
VIGRTAEAARLEALVHDARHGRSGAIVVSGEAGIGKTVLLGHARTLMDGFRVLEATGVEGEAHLAFAGLADCLKPALDRVEDLPEPQSQALLAALGLGPPMPGDRFTAYAGALTLLAAAAEDGPLACLVDDAHWLDTASLEGLLFASRRLEAEGILLLLAAREGVSQLIDSAPLPRLHLDGLAPQDAAALVGRAASVPVAPDVLADLVRGAAGNPLALTELAGALSPHQLSGAEPLPDPLPVGPSLRQALIRPLESFPLRTRQALLVASTDDAEGGLPAALAAAGLSMDDLAPAERAGILLGGPTRTAFSHPLVRSTVYAAAPLPDRRAAHRVHAAAAAAAGDGAALDRRAWHLALASAGPDEEAAAELEAAGGRAMARTGYAAASEAMEASARLSAAPTDLGRRLLGAAQAALASGDLGRAGRLFDEVIALDADPGQTVQAMAARGFTEMFGGSARRAVDMLVAAADRIALAAPPASAGLLVQAIMACIQRADVARATDILETAASRAHGAPPSVAALVEVAAALLATHHGEPRPASDESTAEIARLAAEGDPAAQVLIGGIGWELEMRERYAESNAVASGMISHARARSLVSALPWPLAGRAELLRRTGRLREAAADAGEAIRLAEATGQHGVAAYACLNLALVEAVRGHADDCRAHAARALEGIVPSEATSLEASVSSALGLLALGQGDLGEALSHLGTAERLHLPPEELNPLYDPFLADLIEVRIRLGDVGRAADGLPRLEAQAARAGVAWPAAAAARCRGLMAPDGESEDHFARALDLHQRTPTPFERGRTLLCLGERRRRGRRVREARESLEQALEIFESLGAAPWAEWARRELRAAGAAVREPRPAALEALTPQELQVALAVAEGATNKEAATALLISPKTVEYHLGHVYSKLGVRTRAELARRVAS